MHLVMFIKEQLISEVGFACNFHQENSPCILKIKMKERGEGSQLINTEALFVVCHCVSGGWWLLSDTAQLAGFTGNENILEGSSLWLS